LIGLKDMGSIRDNQSQEIARLQLELADAAQRLDELEQLSLLRARKISSPNSAADCTPASLEESPELRFAACVVSGMTKIRAS
jgi:hypothetical protein